MVTKGFKLFKDNGEYKIEEISTKEQFKCPECISELKGRYNHTNIDTFLDCTLVISLAGVTDSLRIVDEQAFNKNSVLKKIVPNSTLADKCPLPDEIIGDEMNSETAVYEYEKYHTIKMDRDVAGNDDTIHAYLETVDGRLRVRFPNEIRLDAKRNNRKYWIDTYKIQDGSAGGKHVIPLADIVEF